MTMSNKLFIGLILVTAIANAQWVSFSPGGPAALRSAVGSVVKQVQLVSIVACSDSRFSGGQVWRQSIIAGYEPIVTSPGDILNQAARESKKSKLIRWIGYGTIIAAGLVASDVISAGGKTILSLVVSHQLVDSVKEDLKASTPNPSGIISILLDPTKDYPPGCSQLSLVARYRNGTNYKAGNYPL